MNYKKITLKTVQEMLKEKFQQILEKKEQLNKELCEDKTSEQFIKKSEEANLYDKITPTVEFILLFFLYSVICACSVLSSIKGWMELYVCVPISILSMIGIMILTMDTKKNKDT